MSDDVFCFTAVLKQTLSCSKKSVNSILEANGQNLDPEYYSVFKETGTITLKGDTLYVGWACWDGGFMCACLCVFVRAHVPSLHKLSEGITLE